MFSGSEYLRYTGTPTVPQGPQLKNFTYLTEEEVLQYHFCRKEQQHVVECRRRPRKTK